MTEDDPSAPTNHEYAYRCTGCKASYDERPDACESCGCASFVEFREL